MNSGRYAMYLRKSRADLEAELRGEGETLSRHQAQLSALAQGQGLAVEGIYREVASGETIAARPAMQQLLHEVERGMWAGVLVMEIERLARGDTIDQGIVAQAFHYSRTRIITPLKTYDPADAFDEEYLEFGLFMSRREYKAINRRLQQGRLASVREGKYVGNRAPYGYVRQKLAGEKGFSLEIQPEQAEVVRLIFSLFVQGERQGDGVLRQLGAHRIAQRLNQWGIPSATGGPWRQGTVRDILNNPVYRGKIRWNFRKSTVEIHSGQRRVRRPRQPPEMWELADGLHEAIIPEELWQEAQALLCARPLPATPAGRSTQNPLCGLVTCGVCGRAMSRRAATGGRTPPSLICTTPGCPNVSSYLPLVEEKLLAALSRWTAGYVVGPSEGRPSASRLQTPPHGAKPLERRLEETRRQLGHLHDLLEQGIYDRDTFLSRETLLLGRERELAAALDNLGDPPPPAHPADDPPVLFPGGCTVEQVYRGLGSPLAKNRLLKALLEKIVYTKEAGGRWHGSPEAFTLRVYPRIPMGPEHGPVGGEDHVQPHGADSSVPTDAAK